MKKTEVNSKTLSTEEREELLELLQERFENNKQRHKDITWVKVAEKLKVSKGKLWSLHEMERTGGEPDVVAYDKKSDEYIFFDCAAETPKGRRSVCYDHEALEARKEHKPLDSAMMMAANM